VVAQSYILACIPLLIASMWCMGWCFSAALQCTNADYLCTFALKRQLYVLFVRLLLNWWICHWNCKIQILIWFHKYSISRKGWMIYTLRWVFSCLQRTDNTVLYYLIRWISFLYCVFQQELYVSWTCGVNKLSLIYFVDKVKLTNE